MTLVFVAIIYIPLDRSFDDGFLIVITVIKKKILNTSIHMPIFFNLIFIHFECFG